MYFLSSMILDNNSQTGSELWRKALCGPVAIYSSRKPRYVTAKNIESYKIEITYLIDVNYLSRLH